MGCSTQSKGYKIQDLKASKLIVSRDVNFDESYVRQNNVDISTGDDQSSNVVSPGGEVKVDDNIDLSRKSSSESHSSNNEDCDC